MSLTGDSTVSYGGAYRAVCLEVLPDSVRAQIPQVFGATVVTVFQSAGPRPSAGDQGWVFFESGLADYPVWAGTESSTGGGGTAVYPPDGAAGTVLTKASDADNDVIWAVVPTAPGAAQSYHYYQSSPSALWVIVHNLGFFPNVSVVDSLHNEIVGEVNYVDINTVHITFSAAVGGEAYLS